MRLFAYSLSIIVLILVGDVRQLSASRELQANGFVIVEITIGKEKAFQKFKVPIVFDQKERKFPNYKIETIAYAWTGACPEDTGCEVSIMVQADGVDENKSKVSVINTFKNRKRCNVTKEFVVIRGETTELKTKCSTKIKAYYEAQ